MANLNKSITMTLKQKHEQTISVLFPNYIKETHNGVDILIDTSILSNIKACLADLREGKNDEIVHGSLQKCIDKLTYLEDTLKIDRIGSTDTSTCKAFTVDFR